MKKNKQFNTRITNKELELIEATGYKKKEIIPIFLKMFYSSTPKGLKLKIKLLEEENRELEKQIILNNSLIEEYKDKVDNYKDIELIDDRTLKYIGIAIDNYHDNELKYNDFNEYLEMNNELVYLHSKKTSIEIEDYKKLAMDYYNKQYSK